MAAGERSAVEPSARVRARALARTRECCRAKNADGKSGTGRRAAGDVRSGSDGAGAVAVGDGAGDGAVGDGAGDGAVGDGAGDGAVGDGAGDGVGDGAVAVGVGDGAVGDGAGDGAGRSARGAAGPVVGVSRSTGISSGSVVVTGRILRRRAGA
jgi:hypothetical protein